jgi:hypothetical protein
MADLTFGAPMQIKRAAGPLFMMSAEGLPLFERAVPLCGVKKEKESFGFLASTDAEVFASFRGVKIRTAVNRKSASSDAARPNQSSQRNAITEPFSVCDRHSSRG